MKFSDVRGKKILIDTNVPIHYATNGFKERCGNFLRVFKDNNNELAVSIITGYELLNGDPADKRREYFIKFLKYIPNTGINNGILNNATIIVNEYIRLGCKKDIPLPDQIIAGTVAATEDVYLLTADRNDFCEPLWITVAHHIVLKDENKVEVTFYLLKFNHEIILDKYK